MESNAIKVITDLLDDNSFVEFGETITRRSTDFNDKEPKVPNDGVITGHGLINESLVYVYSQDISVMGGTIGEMHAKKIADIYNMASKVGAPVIGFINSRGVRLYESMDAIEAIGNIIRQASLCSGAIQQILAITGTCGGCLNTLCALSDYVVMLEDAKMYINSPNTIDNNHIDKINSSTAEYNYNNGNIDAICNEDTMSILIRNYIDIAPHNNVSAAYDNISDDDLNRSVNYSDSDDVRTLIKEIADDGIFVETKPGIKSTVTGIIRLANQPVGVAANCEIDDESRLDVTGAYKLSDFVRYCDAFNLPLLTITNIDGFKCDFATERSMANALSKLSLSYVHADIPMINLVIKKAYGSGYVFMNSKALGADIVLAYPNCDMAVMSEDKAARILSDNIDDIDTVVNNYSNTHCGIDNAARRGIIDRIINPIDTRKYLIDGFEMLYSKNQYVSIKKHSAK